MCMRAYNGGARVVSTVFKGCVRAELGPHGRRMRRIGRCWGGCKQMSKCAVDFYCLLRESHLGRSVSSIFDLQYPCIPMCQRGDGWFLTCSVRPRLPGFSLIT